MNAPVVRPTLWRTCRVLANPQRLQMLARLAREPGLAVSDIAGELKLSVATASLYLRALEARGFLQSRRVGRHVRYRFAAGMDELSATFLSALRDTLQGGETAKIRVFKLATAFTHPRRIEVVRSLANEPRTVLQLAVVTRMPLRALSRHLHKLQARGFVTLEGHRYRLAEPVEPLAAALLNLARV